MNRIVGNIRKIKFLDTKQKKQQMSGNDQNRVTMHY